MLTEELRKSYDTMPSKNKSLADWKNQGKKALGYLCSYVPEELIYAAGILPVRLLGSTEGVGEASKYLPTYVCHLACSCLDLGMRGELQVLDGVVMPHTCDNMSNLSPIFRRNVHLPFNYWLVIPHGSMIEGAHTFFTKELDIFKQSLEEFSGKEITEEAIKEAIKVYNENRALLRQIYDLRGKDSQPLISGVEAAEMTLSSMLMPKADNNRLLSRIVKEAPSCKDLPSNNGPRIHLSGSLLFDLELFQLIEDGGGMVVSEDQCIGTRYFWNSVDTTMEPMAALGKRYLEKVACPCMLRDYMKRDRLGFIMEMVKRYSVDGVLFSIQRYCDPHQLDYPILNEELRKAGIPTLFHDVHNTIGAAQLRTKLETFFELLGGKR